MKYIFTIILLSWTMTVSGQSSFSRIYDMEFSEWDNIQQIIQVEDQLILIIASTCETFEQQSRCLNIISTDLNGDEQWRIEKPGHEIENDMDIATLWNNHIYVAARDLTTANENNPGQIQALQIDLNGNIVDTHILLNIPPEGFRLSGFIAGADRFTVSAYFDLGNNQVQSRFIFFNSDFSWLGQATLSSEDTRLGFHDIITSEDGGYLLAVSTSITGSVSQRKIIKLSPDGTTQWERILEPSEFSTGTAIATNESGDIFIIYEINEDFFIDPKQYLRVERLDHEGNELWVNTHFIAGEEIRRYERMFLTAGDDMIYVGTGEAMGTDSGYSGFAAKINSEGDLEWEKAYRDADLGGGATNLFTGIALEDGTLLLGGDLRNTIELFWTDPWLLRTNTNGCVYTENCQDLNLITPTRDLNIAPNNFYLTPTLVQDQVTIHQNNETNLQSANIQIITASGQPVQTFLSHGFPFYADTETLSPGFYFLEITSGMSQR